MARVSTYLNFGRNTEEAFNFYKAVFGGEFEGGIARFKDIPPQEGMPPLADADRDLVMHIALPILGGHVLMGTDAPESFGFNVNYGNNVHINLEPDAREETKKIFEKFAFKESKSQRKIFAKIRYALKESFFAIKEKYLRNLRSPSKSQRKY